MSSTNLGCGSGFCSPVFSADGDISDKMKILEGSSTLKELISSDDITKMIAPENIRALTSGEAGQGTLVSSLGCGDGFCSPIV